MGAAGAARRWPARSTACGSSARSRSPPPTSPPAASTRCSSLRPCRSVDAAAAQLIVREAGGAVAFGDLALEEAALGLDARYPIAAAAGERGLATVARRPVDRIRRVTTPREGFKNVCSLRTYVRYTRATPQAGKPKTRRDSIFMATQSNSSNQNAGQTRHHRSEKSAPTPGQTGAKTAVAEKNQAQTVAETAVDLPVGAVLSVSDRVTELVEPFTGRSQRRETDQVLPHRAAPTAEAHRAPRHHRPPQGDHRGPQDPQPGRARGAQAPAHGRDDA